MQTGKSAAATPAAPKVGGVVMRPSYCVLTQHRSPSHHRALLLLVTAGIRRYQEACANFLFTGPGGSCGSSCLQAVAQSCSCSLAASSGGAATTGCN